MLQKVISGGQTGADIAGLVTAKHFGFQTGGSMPYGFKTTDGPRPEYEHEFGCTAQKTASYVSRTYSNVKDSDGTIRLAFNFGSPGEKCTLKAIKQYNKPYIDVDLFEPTDIAIVAEWIIKNKITVLNIAGNSEKTCPGTYEVVCDYLQELFKCFHTGAV